MNSYYMQYFIKFSINETVKKGYLREFLYNCQKLILDYNNAIEQRHSVDYIKNFYTIELFLLNFKDEYVLAEHFCDYIRKLPTKKYNKLFNKSDKNCYKNLKSEILSKINNINY